MDWRSGPEGEGCRSALAAVRHRATRWLRASAEALAVLALFSSALTACGGLAQSPPRFSGTPGEVRVAPASVLDLLLMPSGYESLGEVSVRCYSHESSDIFFFVNTWGECETSRLLNSLRHEVSRVGGEAMVGRRCDTDTDVGKGTDGELSTSKSIVCRAVVARRSSGPPGAIVVPPAAPTELGVASKPPPAAAPPAEARRGAARSAPTSRRHQSAPTHGTCTTLPCAL